MTTNHWKKLRRNLLITLAAVTLAASIGSATFFGLSGGVVTAISVLCLASGFWLTENLVGVMTGVKRANGTALGLLFMGKIGWWGLLFWLARIYPPGAEVPIAIGMGAFLLSLFASALFHFGIPKISEGKEVGDP
jgi:hypothetical protein